MDDWKSAYDLKGRGRLVPPTVTDKDANDIEALTQDAAVDLCEPRSKRSLLQLMSSDSLDLFLYGMPRVPPERWRRCAGLLLEGLPPQQGALLTTHILTAYQQLLRDPALERRPADQRQRRGARRPSRGSALTRPGPGRATRRRSAAARSPR